MKKHSFKKHSFYPGYSNYSKLLGLCLCLLSNVLAPQAIAQSNQADPVIQNRPFLPLIVGSSTASNSGDKQTLSTLIETQKIILDSEALFGHNRASLAKHGEAKIYEMAVKLRGSVNVVGVAIKGYSDETNGTGIAGYNDKLSLERATAVRAYLLDLGFNPALLSVAGMGEKQPVVTDCQRPKGVVQTAIGVRQGGASHQAMDEFRKCLQPNRRVEVEIQVQKTVKNG